MKQKLMISSYLKKFFLEKGYTCVKPHQIVNNADTIFISAGIQPILSDFRNSKISQTEKIYISQPVIRTQFVNSISEGSALAFVNATTSGFNILENDHEKLVRDWLELFYELGMKKENIQKKKKYYEGQWGDLLVSGNKEFYYYNDIEIGDTTFFTKVEKDGKNIGIETMSDVGFGLERIRWSLSNESYFNLFSDTTNMNAEIKALISAIALLDINNVLPSNKNSGYRVRLFSKRLSNLLKGKKLPENIEQYLHECIRYWSNWQEVDQKDNISDINKEYTRNCNRYVLDELMNEGYENLQGININITREDLITKLFSAKIPSEKIKKYVK